MSDWRVVGHTSDGVRRIHGSHDRPPLDSSLMVLVSTVLLNAILLFGLVLVLIHGRESPSGPYSPIQMLAFTLLLLACSLSMMVSAARTLVLRRRLHLAYPATDLVTMLGTDSETLRRTVRDGRIKPVCIVNGRAFYALADFGDPDALLRPSGPPPAESAVLVRPASASGASEASTLLTPAEADSAENGHVL